MIKKILLILPIIAIFGSIFISSIPKLDRYEQRSLAVYDREDNLIAYNLTSDGYLRLKSTVSEVDPLYLKLLLASEDKRFNYHLGIDPLAIIRAFFSNLKAKSTVSGASTIAMQVARNLDKDLRYGYYNKLRQALAAIYLTCTLGQEEILNIYLSTVPMGGNLEGVKAASLAWFGHLPDRLTPAEAALLVALPRSPEKLRPDKFLKSARYYRNDVLRLGVANGVIAKDIAETATKEALPEKMQKIYQDALCLKNFFKTPEVYEYHTNLDPKIQELLKKTSKDYLQEQNSFETLAAVVINNKTFEVVGYLGSANTATSLMDLPHALRSPASTLKPFVYAKAFDSGLLHPKTIVYDEKERFGAWAPVNYSHKFHGAITASDSLANSLNLPTLDIILKLGPQRFFLWINSPKNWVKLAKNTTPHAGISLGAASTSLFDLTNFYAALANDGIYETARLLKSEERSTKYKLLSESSARATYEILKKVRRPDFAPKSEISYKTGTSYHHADAYAIGSLYDYTAAIWVGRPDNRPMTKMKTGFSVASPHLFKLLESIPQQRIPKAPLKEIGALSKDAPLYLKTIKNPQTKNEPLKIDFPQNGSIVKPDFYGNIYVLTKNTQGEVIMTINGEIAPYTSFAPQHEGFYNVCVADENGQSDCVNFKVILNH